MRNNIIEAVKKEKLVVIVRGVPREKLIPLAEAMYDGGIKLLEITFSQDGKITDEETASRIAMLADAMKGRMYIGAGTVTSPEQVELVKKAGGLFIITRRLSLWNESNPGRCPVSWNFCLPSRRKWSA